MLRPEVRDALIASVEAQDELCYGSMQTTLGQCCALGSLAPEADFDQADRQDAGWLRLEALGLAEWAPHIGWETTPDGEFIIAVNDGGWSETPEERRDRVLSWLRASQEPAP